MNRTEPTTAGQAVFQSLMDLEMILQDIEKMVALRAFLESIDPKSRALSRLHAEIVSFRARIEWVVDAAVQRMERRV